VKLQRDLPPGLNLVTAYGAGHVAVNGQRYTGNLVITPQQVEPAWTAAGFDDLQAGDFAALLRFEPEILLFGSGLKQRFPAPALLQGLMQARIGVEIMDSFAACRTYNILVAEGRPVVTALLIE